MLSKSDYLIECMRKVMVCCFYFFFNNEPGPKMQFLQFLKRVTTQIVTWSGMNGLKFV